jgi:hypothetical protein
MTRAQGVVILNAYLNIVRPLQCWAAGDDGLAGFRVRLADPWTWTEKTIGQLRSPGATDKRKAKEQGFKAYVESLVMGERYCADDGKGPAPSLWPRAFDGHL